MSFDADETRHGGTLAIAPAGRLDTISATALDERLNDRIAGWPGAILLDLSAVEYVSSHGLRVILKASKRMAGAGRGFAMCGLSETVADVFRVTGFDRIIAIHGSREEGLRNL